MTYFVILALQCGNSTWSGHREVAVGPGATREQLLAQTRAQAPAPFNTDGTVVFFYCEPNQLGGA